MNYLEATRFLALTLEEDEKREGRIARFMPRRRIRPGKKNRRLGLTTKNSLNPQTNNQEQWEWPDVNLTKDDKRLIFSKVVEGYVGIFCDTQTYTWGGKYYRQVKGLPIGP